MTRFLPGWNSLDLVSGIASCAEAFGIFFLFLLGFAEIVAFVYGHRKDTLTEEASRLQEKAHRLQMEEADRKLADIQQQQVQRRLSAEQKQFLVAALSPFRGRSISVNCVWGDEEGKIFAQDFISMFMEAGWDFGEHPDPNMCDAVYGSTPVGVQVTVNREEARAERFPQGSRELIAALFQLGIVNNDAMYTDPDIPAGHIQVQIGLKVPAA